MRSRGHSVPHVEDDSRSLERFREVTRKKRRGEKSRQRPLELSVSHKPDARVFCATARQRILTRCAFRHREIVSRDRAVPVIDGLEEYKYEIYTYAFENKTDCEICTVHVSFTMGFMENIFLYIGWKQDSHFSLKTDIFQSFRQTMSSLYKSPFD